MRARNRDERVDLVWIENGPFERLHAAERSTGHGGKPIDTKLVEEGALRAYHVGNGDHWKVGSIGPTCGRID